jgi:hypothetical protein
VKDLLVDGTIFFLKEIIGGQTRLIHLALIFKKMA